MFAFADCWKFKETFLKRIYLLSFQLPFPCRVAFCETVWICFIFRHRSIGHGALKRSSITVSREHYQGSAALKDVDALFQSVSFWISCTVSELKCVERIKFCIKQRVEKVCADYGYCFLKNGAHIVYHLLQTNYKNQIVFIYRTITDNKAYIGHKGKRKMLFILKISLGLDFYTYRHYFYSVNHMIRL